MEPKVLQVVPVSSILDETGNLTGRISSAPSYDKALSEIFPHFVHVSYEDAEALGAVLDRGILNIPMDGTVGSYASVVDLKSGGKILWLSDSSLHILRSKLNPQLFSFEDVPWSTWTRPRHLA